MGIIKGDTRSLDYGSYDERTSACGALAEAWSFQDRWEFLKKGGP